MEERVDEIRKAIEEIREAARALVEEVKDAKTVTLKSGRKAITGTCPTCGTKVFKFIKG